MRDDFRMVGNPETMRLLSQNRDFTNNGVFILDLRNSLEIVACIQRTSCILSGGVSLPKEQAAISRFIATGFVVIEIGFIFLILARVEEENPCS